MKKVVQLSYDWKGNVLSVSSRQPDKSLKLLQSFDFAKVPESLDEKFIQIGRRTKLGNFATEAETVAEKLSAMTTGFEMLCQGQWEAEGQRGGPTVSVEAEAVARIKSITVAQAQKAMRALKEASPEKYEALLKSARVVAEIAAIKAEKAETESVDLSDLT